MMVSQMSPPFLLVSTIFFFFFAGHHPHLKTLAQLLPIVDPQGVNSSTIQTYIVHVHEPEDTDLLGSEDRENWYRSFLPNATLDSGEPRLVYSYNHAISGFAARLTLDELKVMETMDGFVSAHPDRHHPLLTTHTPEFLGLDGWDRMWEKSNYGEGVIIGVLDSGIIPNHPSFRDDDMPDPPKRWRGCCLFNVSRCDKFVPSICNKKLLGAIRPGFSSSPIDKLGHGTHVAGTAAGNVVSGAEVLGQAKGNAIGMAPRAHLAAYKVCIELGKDHYRCSDSSILSGIDHAIEDGVDVLSISIGTVGERFYDSSIIKGTFAAMEKKGIIASCCAGNEGITESAIANDAPWILTVGASSIDRVVRATVRLGNGMEFDGESAYQPSNFTSPMMPIEYPGVVDTDQMKACQQGSLDKLDVKGKIVLCGVGFNENINKGEIVKAAGGTALIVLNQVWDGFTTKSEPHVIPTAHVNHVDALKIMNYFSTTTNATATIIFKGTKMGSRRSPAVASFSSRGPSLVNGGIIKPDIIGPGVNILAAWHTDVGPDATGSSTSSFNFASGCSMATPHLAGIAALLKSAHPKWTPAAIKSAIMTTAHTLDRYGQPITDEKSKTLEPASYFAMGAGHVNPSKAIDPGLIYELQSEDYIAYLCTLRYTDNQIETITGRKNIHCSTVQKISAEQLNYPSILVSLDSSSSKNITRTVTNVGDAASIYSLQITAPQGASVVVSPNKLQFTKLKEEKSFTVTFSKKGSSPGKGKYSEGQLSWVSGKYVVRSPIAVKF